MLSVAGDAAVKARIRIGWNKFRQLVGLPLLANRDISLIRIGRLYSSCERSSTLHGRSGKKRRWYFMGRDENGQMDA